MSGKDKDKPITLKIGPQDEKRIDRFLAETYPSYSRTFFKRLIESHLILVEGHWVTPHQKLHSGEVISIRFPSKKSSKKIKKLKNLPFPVLFEDDVLLILNKPAGLLVHPARKDHSGETLVDYLWPKIRHSDWPDEVRPGLVHRLDRDTSGVMVFAKTPQAHTDLSSQFSQHRINKTYIALVKGVLPQSKGTFECKLARDPKKRKQFRVSGDGRVAITKFEVKETYGDKGCLVELHPKTGRTHQLRVQLAHYGHPIWGDVMYGGIHVKEKFAPRHLLHAAKLMFWHPVSHKPLTFETPLPPDFQMAIKHLE